MFLFCWSQVQNKSWECPLWVSMGKKSWVGQFLIQRHGGYCTWTPRLGPKFDTLCMFCQWTAVEFSCCRGFSQWMPVVLLQPKDCLECWTRLKLHRWFYNNHARTLPNLMFFQMGLKHSTSSWIFPIFTNCPCEGNFCAPVKTNRAQADEDEEAATRDRRVGDVHPVEISST